MNELILAIVGGLGGLGAAAATIISALRKADEGNYVTLQNRLETVETTVSRQANVIRHLSHWQLTARELDRQQRNELVRHGIEPTETMLRLQAKLDEELTYDEMMTDPEPHRRPRRRGRRQLEG